MESLSSFPVEQAEPVETANPNLSSLLTQLKLSYFGVINIEVFHNLGTCEPNILMSGISAHTFCSN